MVSNVTPAVLHTSQSSDLAICVPTEFDINLYPHFQNASPVHRLAGRVRKKIVGAKQPVWNAPSRPLLNDNTFRQMASVIGLSLSACAACRRKGAKGRKLHWTVKKQG